MNTIPSYSVNKETVKTVKTVYLVKFDTGYYAKKQKHYHWSFTDNPELANQYTTLKQAQERGEWGLNLVTDRLQSYEIETYEIVTTMQRVS